METGFTAAIKGETGDLTNWNFDMSRDRQVDSVELFVDLYSTHYATLQQKGHGTLGRLVTFELFCESLLESCVHVKNVINLSL